MRSPRAHSGLAPNEKPIIIRDGEGVFTPGQMKALGGGDVIVNNYGGADVRARKDGNRTVIDIDAAVANVLARQGSMGQRAVALALGTLARFKCVQQLLLGSPGSFAGVVDHEGDHGEDRQIRDQCSEVNLHRWRRHQSLLLDPQENRQGEEGE